MGYRSEVAYVIRFKDKAQKEAFINIQRAKADKAINGALDDLVEVEDNMLGYHADYVKWYTDYEDVKAHETLMKDSINLFNETPDGNELPYDEQAGYKFIRLGEESDDNEDEERGNAECLYEYLDWTKSITTSFTRNTYEANQSTEGETA